MYPFIIPFSIGHVFWVSWCSGPFANNFQGQGTQSPPAGFNVGGYNPIVTYSSCPAGEIWKPNNVSCFGCYCINGYVSRCFFISNCPEPSTSSSSSSTATFSTETKTLVSASASTQQSILINLETENDGSLASTTSSPADTLLVRMTGMFSNRSRNSTAVSITSTSSIFSESHTTPVTLSPKGTGGEAVVTEGATAQNTLESANIRYEDKMSHSLPERRLNDLLVLSLFNHAQYRK